MNAITTISTRRRRKRPIFQCLFILWVVLSCSPLYGQFTHDYDLIKVEGRIPNDFLNLVRGQSRITIQNTERLTKIQREQFRDATNFSLHTIFKSGQIYFNDPLTEYVREVGKKILVHTGLEEKIQFYVSKSYEMNASSWQTGTILINIGLLSQLESEGQLAYVLAHEVAHYQMQHPYKQYAQQIKEHPATQNSKLLVKNFREHFDYSLQYELEADSAALQLMKDANYKVEESVNTLNILLRKGEREMVNLVEYLSSEDYLFDPNSLCDFKEYSAFKKNAFNSAAPQHFSDHHIKKRLELLEKIIERDFPPGPFALNVPKSYNRLASNFYTISKVAHFEVIHQAAQDANYLKSIFEAMVMIRDFPNNQFLHITIAENFYYIAHYNQLNLLDRIFFDKQLIEEDEYAKLCCLVNNTDKTELQVMIYGFVKKLYKDYPTNETMLITMAKLSEQHKGVDAAKPYYQKYVKLFPSGKHYLEAKRKL